MATILIVDTNPGERRLYITLLGNFGHRLLEANDGFQALELARAELPDLVITDNVLLPNMDGIALVQHLHSEPLLAGTPIIFHTGNYEVSEVHQLARTNGIKHILRKPAEPQEILRVVNESLKRPMAVSNLPKTGQLQREHLQILADKLYQKVSELEQANERLRQFSLTDGLTGLNNRRGFMILATGLLKFARRANYSLSLLYIDLDSLKYINDTFGHVAGDTAIIHFAHLLLETFRESDVIGRMGGDEFVVMIMDASESDLASMQSRLQSVVELHNQQVESGYALAYSLGIIRVEAKSSITMEKILAEADAAMYQHKLSRRRKA
jgi:diguanylate cyclase (GGDEF)-like protein